VDHLCGRKLRILKSIKMTTTEATYWTNAANFAGDFIMQLFDATNRRFNTGSAQSAISLAPRLQCLYEVRMEELS
jgi:hypothetical protein